MYEMKISLAPKSLSLFFVVLSACTSSKKVESPKRVDQEPASWDYAKIREARAGEASTTAEQAQNTDNDYAQCQIYSKDAMIRAKVSGCRPTDPRDGFGVNTYCCPPQK